VRVLLQAQPEPLVRVLLQAPPVLAQRAAAALWLAQGLPERMRALRPVEPRVRRRRPIW